MKNIKLFGLLLLAFAAIMACEPLEDDIDEITADQAETKDMTYTLTSDDYDELDDICECTGFGNFSSEDDVNEFLPEFLAQRFPALGDGSSAIVTYDFFNGSSPDLRGDRVASTVTPDEYDTLGFSFGNFSDLESDIPAYADFKWGPASDGDYADIFHQYWTGSEVVLEGSRAVYTVAYGWMYANVIPNDAYGDYFDESGIDFSFEDEGVEKVPAYIKDTQKFAKEGDIQLWQFNYDGGEDEDGEDIGPVESVALYILQGENWIEYGDATQVTQETVSLAHDGTVWVPDNTIKYSLASADYAAIADAYASSNASGSASMAQFGNYDLTLWSDEEIFESIAARLVELFEEVEGQKYLVTYATWEPGAGSGTIHVIWDGEAYVPVEE